MTHLPGHDRYLSPRGNTEITVHVDGCEDYIASRRLQTEDLDIDLARLEALLVPNEDGYPSTRTIDRAVAMIRAIRAEQSAMPEAEDVECGYVGDVDAYGAGGEVRWTCPRCGNEQSRDADDFAPEHPDL